MLTDSQDCPSESAEPVALLRAILKALDASGCRYALIHPERNLGEAVSSDVDIAFDEIPHKILLPIVQQLSTIHDARLIQCLHYDIPHGYYYVLSVASARCRFLHLDCLYDPIGVNRYHLPTRFLLEEAVAEPWARQTSKERMAVYLLMKRAIKGRASPEALVALSSCFSDASDVLWSHVRNWFGPRAEPLIAQLLEAGSAEGAAAVLTRLRASAEKTFRRTHPLRYLLSLPLNVIRKVRRFVQPTGLFVVVVGPDGVGKSTVTGLVMSRLARTFRRTWRFHWRPGLLPKLGRGGRRLKEGHETDGAPPELSKYRGVVSLTRFLYYWLDFVVGYWLSVYLRKAQSTLVLGERYFPDVLVHPQRYGFAVPRWLIRLAATCVPSPDLLVLLKDDPNVIYARKAELSPLALAAQLAAYGDEIEHWGKAVTITTEGGADAVARRVCDLILDACADRTAQRLERYSRQPGWRGFPSAVKAKVWVSDQDTPHNALNLYHPYSSFGRFATRLIRRLPSALFRRLFAECVDPHLNRQFSWIQRVIRKTLNNEQMKVSFYTGTPGAHRKMTAQASHHGHVVSYVKIANSPLVCDLLQHENETLALLHYENFQGADVPTVLAFEHHESYTLLFQSAPTCASKQRPLQPDGKDVAFLSALWSHGAETVTASTLLEAMHFDTFLQRMHTENPVLGDTVQTAMELVCDILAQAGVRVVFSHGDFAPWNTLELGNGRLYVFDWEYSRKQAPIFSDLFHRIFMPARLVLREPPEKIVTRLLQVAENPVLARLVSESGVAEDHLPAYLLLYLLDLAITEEMTKKGVSTFILECIGCVLTRHINMACRPTVLVAAYACEPGGGSEPGVGWNMCQAISREHNVWVITRENNRAHIEQALAEQPNPYLHFSYVDLPRWARFWKKGGRGIRTYYYLWQFAAWRAARRLMQTVHFDLAHHVTFVNSYLFSFLALLPLPFIWGPIGNHPKWPPRLVSNPMNLIFHLARYHLQQLLRIADPLYWLCTVRARLIVGINPQIGLQFPLSVLGKNKFSSFTAIGVEDTLSTASSKEIGSRFQVLSVGRLVELKGFHLTVMAFAKLALREPQAKLLIVGEGPSKLFLQKLVKDLDLERKVDFCHWLPRADALALMHTADVFLFPSFEGGGMVVLEAMQHKLPVICLEWGGPGEMVTRDCGFVVKVGSMDDTVENLARALKTLAENRTLRAKLGTAAKQRVQERYLWEDRHEIIRQWYSTILSKNARGVKAAAIDGLERP